MPRIPFDQIPEQLMACMMQTEKHVMTFKIIDESFMELLRYHVSLINECTYCIDMHFKEAIAAGESQQRLYSVPIWRETGFYTEIEQSILDWTESVTLLKRGSKQWQFAFSNLVTHFNQDEIANLTLAIIQINSWNRLAKSFGFVAGTYQVGQH